MQLRRSFDLYLSTVRAVENYRPPASPVPVALLRAARAGEGEGPETAAGWSRLSTVELDVREVPGDHLTMLREPHVSALAEILRERLARAEQLVLPSGSRSETGGTRAPPGGRCG